jgi:hypothetical protein
MIIMSKQPWRENDYERIIEVLEREREILLNEFYKPEVEGTGHFNTAASVLEMRINSYKAKLAVDSLR